MFRLGLSNGNNIHTDKVNSLVDSINLLIAVESTYSNLVTSSSNERMNGRLKETTAEKDELISQLVRSYTPVVEKMAKEYHKRAAWSGLPGLQCDELCSTGESALTSKIKKQRLLLPEGKLTPLLMRTVKEAMEQQISAKDIATKKRIMITRRIVVGSVFNTMKKVIHQKRQHYPART